LNSFHHAPLLDLNDELLLRNSEQYSVRGEQELIYFIAEILSVEQVDVGSAGAFYTSEARVTLDGPGLWEGNAVIAYDSPLRVGDLVEAVGYYQGLKTFTSTRGGPITYPWIAVTGDINVLLEASG